jgi:ribose 1,5-bisphosphokinase PhnN
MMTKALLRTVPDLFVLAVNQSTLPLHEALGEQRSHALKQQDAVAQSHEALSEQRFHTAEQQDAVAQFHEALGKQASLNRSRDCTLAFSLNVTHASSVTADSSPLVPLWQESDALMHDSI